MQNYGYGYNGYTIPPESYLEGGETGGKQLNLRFYWYAILERRWLVLITFLIVMSGALVYLMKAPRIYRATVQLQIDPETPADLNFDQTSPATMRMDAEYLQTQYKKLKSRSLLETVIRREHLDQDPRYARYMDIVEAVSDDIKVQPIRMTRLVNVSVDHPDPRKAAAIANAIAEEFIKQNANQRQKRILDLLFLLKTQAAELERDVTAKEEAVQKYREQKSFVSFEAGENIIAQALSQSQARYAEARARARTAESTLKQVEKHIQSGNPIYTFPTIASDPEISSLRQQLALLRSELAALLKRYKDKHPKVIELRSKIAGVTNSIQRVAQEKLIQLKAEVQLAKAQEQELADNVAYWEERQMEWNKAKAEYDVLRRQADISQQLYTLVLGKLKEIDLMTRNRANNIIITDPAVPPVEYTWPNIALTLVGGTLGGLILAVGLALFVAYMDDSIKSQDDVETYLRLPFLGYIPDIKAKDPVRKMTIAHTQPQSNAAESFRSVRAAIALGAHGDRRRILAVTSTLPGEGKSLTATNLAIVIAQTGAKTLLIDADMRRPSLHRAFKVDRSKGLSDYLSGDAKSINEVVHATEVPNLDLIPAGPKSNQPAELLGGKRMEQLLEEASTQYDRVIIDTPPISAVSDPLIVGVLTDGVVYVIKFNKIRRELAKKCIQRMLDAGIHVCGALLNDLDFEGRDAYYAYYYYTHYYYHHRYYGYGRKRKRTTRRSEQKVSTEQTEKV